MQPGLLRERVDIQRAAETRNALGEVTQTWATYASRYAAVMTLRSREALNAQQAGLSVTHKVKLRHVEGLKSSDRLVWRGRTLEIVSVLEFEQFTVHELLCEEQA
jgi:SPP1 family predicted phage head-tail adaptor